MEEEEIKKYAEKYLNRVYWDISDARESFIKGANKEDIEEKLNKINFNYDIVSDEEFKEDWEKLVDEFEKMDENDFRQKLMVDKIFCDLANKIAEKRMKLREEF